jgi:hypothetical protein
LEQQRDRLLDGDSLADSPRAAQEIKAAFDEIVQAGGAVAQAAARKSWSSLAQVCDRHQGFVRASSCPIWPIFVVIWTHFYPTFLRVIRGVMSTILRVARGKW